MALLNSTLSTPIGGWRYVQPETKVRFNEESYTALVAAVKAHREYKGIPADDIEHAIQTQICWSNDTRFCTPEPGETYTPVNDLTASLTTEMAVSLGKALLKFVLTGGEFVSKEVAQKRADTCRGCIFNKPASLCSCSKAYSAIEALIPEDRKVAGVSVCMACGCSLQAKVNLPDEVIQASLSDGVVLPPWCWQRKVSAPS